MVRLAKSLNAWGTGEFQQTLVEEIEQLSVRQLPLQRGMSTSSYAIDDNLKAMILSVSEGKKFIRVKAGIFYKGIIPGCSCADDPTPVDENNEYCEVLLDIDKETAGTEVMLVEE